MEMLLLVITIIFSALGIVVYYKFFKNAKPINAQALNEIQFGRTVEYMMPVEDDRSKELIVEPPRDHTLDDWHKEGK